MVYEQLRDHLIAARRAQKLSMTQVGQRFGVSRQTINNWEKGHSRAPWEVLPQWAEALGRRLVVALPPKEDSPLREEITSTIANLSDEDQRLVFQVARLLSRLEGAPKRLLVRYLAGLEEELPTSETGSSGS